jgi:DNA-binding beta-propeller fold protein YncE
MITFLHPTKYGRLVRPTAFRLRRLFGIQGFLLPIWLVFLAVAPAPAPAADSNVERVGRIAADRIVTPVNQVLTPAGAWADLPGLRPQALALSPDGALLVVSGKSSALLALDPASGQIRQTVPLPNERSEEPQPGVVSPNILAPDKKGQVSYTGLVFSPDGKWIYFSNVNGSLKVFRVAADGTVTLSHSIRLPKASAPRRDEEIPSGLAVTPDGKRLLVCGNLSNKLLEIETATGKVLRQFEVGVAPYDVVLVRGKAYVSNWGGRRPQEGDLTGPAGRGTVVRVDSVRHIASEGSVSIVDLGRGKVKAELVTGRHASALALSPNKRYLVCANAASDNLSVIDTRSDRIVETIWAKPNPSELFGASPNALVFDSSGRTLYVANGTQNAVGVIRFDPSDRESKLMGLIPVGWFPGALVYDAKRKTIDVANIKGLGPGRPRKSNGKPEFNSHQYYGSVSLVPEPSAQALAKYSQAVWRNLRREAVAAAKLPPRQGQPPRPVPERIGEPSLFKHVVYVIKENRTYDQVLGDEARGNGDPELCVFGARVTPNQHKLVKEFVLLDNTYCAGILSADGHQWSTTAMATDYMEKSFAGFPRSYPDGMGVDESDALAYSPAGFIWDNAIAHGKTLRDYGEFAAPAVRWRDPKRKGGPNFLACYRTWKGQNDDVVFASYPMIESVRPYLPTNYVGWEMTVPDQYRADYFIRELKAFEEQGSFPELVLICLPDDHTSGTRRGSPTPAACVADNDLAFGRIVEAISHSKFWKDTVVFGIEDDPQAGWDHVSGYRTTAYCASPYTKRGVVVHTQYNTTSVLRTIEQILGLPPMNQFDASATPMFDCFTESPDFAPFDLVPNLVALDQMNPAPQAIRDPLLRRNAYVSARINFREADRAPEDVLNRILWHAMKGPKAPYPTWAVDALADGDED